MKGQEVVLSRGWNGWPTPRDLFAQLNESIKFTIDLAAAPENALLERFYTEEQDSLQQNWGDEFGFLNPPYNRCKDFIEKCRLEDSSANLVIALVPCRTDTKWFQALPENTPIFFFKGRLCFGNREKNSPAPFPSCLIVFGKQKAWAYRMLLKTLEGRGRWTIF